MVRKETAERKAYKNAVGMAQAYARRELSYKYPDEYRTNYLKHKGESKGTKMCAYAFNKAKTDLVQKYKSEYDVLYQIGLAVFLPRRSSGANSANKSV